MKFRIQIIITVTAFIAITAYCCKQIQKPNIIPDNNKHIAVIDSLSDIYDNDTNIVYWELLNDTVHLYTKEDSARDELKRIKYIQSIEPFPSEFDSLFNIELQNEN